MTAPAFVGPTYISATGWGIRGLKITDDFAAGNPGTVTLNISCQHGRINLPGITAAASVSFSGTFAAMNTELVSLSYLPTLTQHEPDDVIHFDYWNQAGVNITYDVPIAHFDQVLPPPYAPPGGGGGGGGGTGGDPTGVQAYRAKDFLKNVGAANMFPTMDSNNFWGAAPADYTPTTVNAILDAMMASSGCPMTHRVYFYQSRLSLMQQWLPLLAAKGHRFVIDIGANGSASDVPGILTLAADPTMGIVQIGGINEPNTNFGSGTVPIAQVKAAQDALWAGKPAGVKVAGPSYVWGMTGTTVWIAPTIAQADVDYLNARMDVASVHAYMPSAPNNQGQWDAVMTQLSAFYGGKPISLTEWEPTLYGSGGLNNALSAYYMVPTLCAILESGLVNAQWFPFIDYGWDQANNRPIFPCGFTPQNNSGWRPSYYVANALHTLLGDPGATAGSFTPAKLNYTVSGGQAAPSGSPKMGVRHTLLQKSNGVFGIVLRNEQLASGGSATATTVTFNGLHPSSVKEYKITGDPTFGISLQTVTNAASITSQLDASNRVLIVTP